MTREQRSVTVAMDQTTVQKCEGSQRCKMIAAFENISKGLLGPQNYADAHMALIIIMVAL